MRVASYFVFILKLLDVPMITETNGLATCCFKMRLTTSRALLRITKTKRSSSLWLVKFCPLVSSQDRPRKEARSAQGTYREGGGSRKRLKGVIAGRRSRTDGNQLQIQRSFPAALLWSWQRHLRTEARGATERAPSTPGEVGNLQSAPSRFAGHRAG